MKLDCTILFLFALNYAEDRLDRKARGNDLWQDFQQGLMFSDHSTVGRTLRDVGWIRHASFHLALQSQDDKDGYSGGDYAQMAEFSGYPEIALLALLYQRMKPLQKGAVPSISNNRLDDLDESWLQRPQAPTTDCGCGFPECGIHDCSLPFSMDDVEPILDALAAYVDALPSRASDATAHTVLTAIANKRKQDIDTSHILPLLRYWESSDESYRELPPVSQLLLTKLLYQVIPPLAAEGVTQIEYPKSMARAYKSHNAYQILIKASVLGERIKPRRIKSLPVYHVPIWDVLFGHNVRLGLPPTPWNMSGQDLKEHFIQCIHHCNTRKSYTLSPPPLLFPKDDIKSIFLVGDSHIFSTSWQLIRLPNGQVRRIVPTLVTGLKAWHCRTDTHFYTHSLLHKVLERLKSTNAETVIISVGEIDCREGIGGPKLEGYNNGIMEEAVDNTIEKLIESLTNLPMKQILLLPVAPHAHKSERYGKAESRKLRRQLKRYWNQRLREMLPRENVAFFDYEEDLMHPGDVLNPSYNADATHMNSAFLPCLENAMVDLNGWCDWDLL